MGRLGRSLTEEETTLVALEQEVLISEIKEV